MPVRLEAGRGALDPETVVRLHARQLDEPQNRSYRTMNDKT